MYDGVMYKSNALYKVQVQGSAVLCFGFLVIGIFAACMVVPLFFAVEDVSSNYLLFMSGVGLFSFVVHGFSLRVFIRDYKRYKEHR